MLSIALNYAIDETELSFEFIRSPGPGGQNVNKVATAVLLRFNVKNCSLPEEIRERLMAKLSPRLTLKGDLLIKATRFRTQERNKQDAINRLQALLAEAVVLPKKRRKTQPSYSAKQRRLSEKKKNSQNKSLRSRKIFSDH